MKVGSLFAGIGGFDLGFERAGFEVAWCAEWDKNAQAVLRTRFPRATVYGDIREIDLDALEPVDVICGGFPCQDLSVAGKRAGLAGARSGLFHDAMRIVRRLQPSVLILENVPGLLSSNHGLDFATVLREVGEGWNCAEVGWRVLDSQYFGVAQRRRRVFVVGGSRIGCAESILALAESCGGDPPSRGATREEPAADARGGAASRRVVGSLSHDDWKGHSCNQTVDGGKLVVGALDCDIPKQRVQNMMAGHWIPVVSATIPIQDGRAIEKRQNGIGIGSEGDPSYTLDTTGGQAVAFRKSKRAQTNTDDETWVDDGVANTLNGFDTGDTRTTHAIAFHPTQDPISSADGSTHALGCGNRQGCATVAVAVDLYNHTETGDVAATMSCAVGHAGGSGPKVRSGMTVRRLTPTECERLQGFPDGWTQIGTDKPTADSHRYKQLGNAVTVNVAEWIARRVAAWMRAQDSR